MLRSAIAACALWVLGCGHDHGPPRVTRSPDPYGMPALRGQPLSPRIASYKIEARLDAARHQITASETLTWKNTGQSPVDELPFHLYLNAFKNEQSQFMQTSRGVMRNARASDTAWGYIQVDSVQIAGTELVKQLEYPGLPDETVAKLKLAQPIAPGETVAIDFKFTDQLPEVFARTGYKGEFHMVGQWFPKIGVRLGPPGEEHWECAALSAFTEFFADFGVYDVTLTVPNTEVVAATGGLVSATDAPGGTRTLVYHAEDVHDFAWMADPYMKVISGKATLDDGTVTVKVYARPEQAEFAKRHLDTAIRSIEKFSAAYVPYPWSVMTVVDPPIDAAAGAGGMEYPTLVTTGPDSVWFGPGVRVPEFTTVHEVGHNWFQGMLASNEPVEAWLDEGVNEWADGHVMDELYGARTSGLDWAGFTANFTALRLAIDSDAGSVPQPLATAAYAFVDSDAYDTAEYGDTLRALTTLERMVGTAKLAAAMKVYAKTWAFKHPTGRDLFDVLQAQLGEDLSWFFTQEFEQVGGMRLSVRSAGCRPAHAPRGVFGDGAARKQKGEAESPDTGASVCEVVVQNMGVLHAPVDVELRFADGTTQRLLWNDRDQQHWQRFVVEHSSRLVEVRLDPDGKLALESPVRYAVRLEGDGSASLRAAARMGAWAQTVMQLVGP